MAAIDYKWCDVCGCKTFYDATLDYNFKEYPVTGLRWVGAWAVLCDDCALTHTIEIKKAQPPEIDVKATVKESIKKNKKLLDLLGDKEAQKQDE